MIVQFIPCESKELTNRTIAEIEEALEPRSVFREDNTRIWVREITPGFLTITGKRVDETC